MGQAYRESSPAVSGLDAAVHGANVQMRDPMADKNLVGFSDLTPPQNIFAYDLYKASNDRYNKAIASIYEQRAVDDAALVLSRENVKVGIFLRKSVATEYTRLAKEGLNHDIRAEGASEMCRAVADVIRDDISVQTYSLKPKDKHDPAVITMSSNEVSLNTEVVGNTTEARLIQGDMSPESMQQFTLHHEYAHRISAKEYLDKHHTYPTGDGWYKSYLEESRADTQAVLMMIKQGADKEVLDGLTAWRTMAAVYQGDDYHFTGHCLQGIKNELTAEQIRDMSVDDIVEYTKGVVSRHAMDMDAYEAFSRSVHIDRNQGEESNILLFNMKLEARLAEGVDISNGNVTSLEMEEVLSQRDGFSQAEKEFLEKFYIPMKDTVAFAKDFENGRTRHPASEELYRNKVRAERGDDYVDDTLGLKTQDFDR